MWCSQIDYSFETNYSELIDLDTEIMPLFRSTSEKIFQVYSRLFQNIKN